MQVLSPAQTLAVADAEIDRGILGYDALEVNEGRSWRRRWRIGGGTSTW